MTSREDEFDALIDALRSDLPSASDERRVRRRLVAAGVGVATGIVTVGAEAAGPVAGSSFGVALVQKLGALSWVAKMGLAGIAAAVAVPGTAYLTSTAPRHPAQPTTAPSPVADRLPKKRVFAPVEALPRAESPAGARSAEGERPSIETSAAPRRTVPGSALRPPAASSALPVDPRAFATTENTLREETELVERALYALKLGDHDGARGALELHASRFPNGLLARERERALVRLSSQEDSIRRAR